MDSRANPGRGRHTKKRTGCSDFDSIALSRGSRGIYFVRVESVSGTTRRASKNYVTRCRNRDNQGIPELALRKTLEARAAREEGKEGLPLSFTVHTRETVSGFSNNKIRKGPIALSPSPPTLERWRGQCCPGDQSQTPRIGHPSQDSAEEGKR